MRETFAGLEDRLIARGRALEADGTGSARHPDKARMPEWNGARVLVTADFTYESQKFGFELVVRTRHAQSLSWLIFELRDVFSEYLDAQNKYGFYESLAQAALAHLAAHQPEADDHRPLLRQVLSVGFEYFELLRTDGAIPPTPRLSLAGTDVEGRQMRLYVESELDEEDDSP
jgi:hypothetical protein